MAWLDSKPPASVVYVSFGSMSALSVDQMAELASGLANSEESAERGLMVGWSPQLEVLAHTAVGCFLTHCGWNSMTEALSLGVPVVAMPQWTDQPTNAKYAEDVWGMGARVKAAEEGALVRREEVERCVREVMEGPRSGEMRRKAAKCRELAKAAVGENGSSDVHIMELIAKYCNMKKAE